jgi:hypothetical protein
VVVPEDCRGAGRSGSRRSDMSPDHVTDVSKVLKTVSLGLLKTDALGPGILGETVFAAVGRHSAILPDAHPEQPGEGLEPRGQFEPAQAYRPSFWPPGPNADWTGLQPWPSEYRVPGVDDGFPSRVERSNYCARVRSLGNAVAPPAAAVAYVRLLRRIEKARNQD